LSEGAYSSLDDAAAALSASSATPEPAQAPEPVVEAPETSDAPAVTPEGQPTEGATAEPDSFTKTDLNSLLEGVTDPAARDRIEAAYRGFQGDYTRKTQALSEQAKAYDGLDPERARASLQFVEALENDPTFAARVHQELTNALTSQGYSPSDASAAAAATMSESLGDGEFGDEKVSALAKELNELKDWKQGFEQEQQANALAARIQNQELAIRQANPDLRQDEIDKIYGLAFSPTHAGDLSSAAESYLSWKNDTIAAYLNSKAEVPPAAPPVTGHSEVPVEAPVDMKSAGRAAREYFERSMAGE
jgi:hypothetical protein